MLETFAAYAKLEIFSLLSVKLASFHFVESIGLCADVLLWRHRSQPSILLQYRKTYVLFIRTISSARKKVLSFVHPANSAFV